MGKRGWIITLVVVGVGIAVVVGLAANSQTVAENQLCSSLGTLQSDVANVQNLDPSSTSKSTLQSDFSDIQSDWNSVKSDAQNVHDLNMDSIDDAWDDFESAVKAIPDDASVSDAQSAVSQSAQALQSAVKSTMGDADCSSS